MTTPTLEQLTHAISEVHWPNVEAVGQEFAAPNIESWTCVCGLDIINLYGRHRWPIIGLGHRKDTTSHLALIQDIDLENFQARHEFELALKLCIEYMHRKLEMA